MTRPVKTHGTKTSIYGALLTLGLAFGAAGCISYDPAPGTPGRPEVTQVVEEVLKERYYQTRTYGASGHVVAYSQVRMEGVQKVRKRVDVHVRYENTKHFIPLVYVRKFYDLEEPPLETGDFASVYESNHPHAKSNWTAMYYDHGEEEEIRSEILARLSIR